MKKRFITVAISLSFLIASKSYSQNAETEGLWKVSGTVGINLTQTSFTNWSQGGENSIAYSVFGNFGLNYSKEAWNFTNSLKLTYGQTKLGKAEIHTTDNEFYLEDVLTYNVGWKLEPYVSNIAKTVLSAGYDYSQIPSVQNSAFFDPGYLSQSMGFSYEKGETFKTRFGAAVQETFTSKFTKYADDPETSEVENTKVEGGIESVTEAKFMIVENVQYQGYLRLFGRFKELGVWDVRWDNTITMKVNSFLNVNLNVLTVYKKYEMPKTQIKESFMLGFSYTLF